MVVVKGESPVASSLGISANWARARMKATFAAQLVIVAKRLKKADALALKTGTVKPNSSHARYMQVLRQGAKAMAVARVFEVSHNVHEGTVEAEQAIQTGKAVIEVEDPANLEEVAYWQQGDASLATKEKMAERQALRYHPRVLEALQLFWEAAQRSMQSGGDSSASELSQEGHALMLRRIYKVMIREFDSDDCDKCIAEDWERDAKGKDKLSRKLFCDAFFELADNWTQGISAVEYALFLKTLYDSVTVQKAIYGPDGQLMMVSFVWKDEQDCIFDEAYAVEDEEEAAPEMQDPLDAEPASPMSPMSEPGKDYRDDAKKNVQKKAEKSASQNTAATKIQARHRAKKACKETEEKQQALKTIQKHARGRAARKQAKKTKTAGPNFASDREHRSREAVKGERGQLQYWALRKGLPPKLAEALEGLTEEDQAIIFAMDEGQRVKFLEKRAEKKEKLPPSPPPKPKELVPLSSRMLEKTLLWAKTIPQGPAFATRAPAAPQIANIVQESVKAAAFDGATETAPIVAAAETQVDVVQDSVKAAAFDGATETAPIVPVAKAGVEPADEAPAPAAPIVTGSPDEPEVKLKKWRSGNGNGDWGIELEAPPPPPQFTARKYVPADEAVPEQIGSTVPSPSQQLERWKPVYRSFKTVACLAPLFTSPPEPSDSRPQTARRAAADGDAVPNHLQKLPTTVRLANPRSRNGSRNGSPTTSAGSSRSRARTPLARTRAANMAPELQGTDTIASDSLESGDGEGRVQLVSARNFRFGAVQVRAFMQHDPRPPAEMPPQSALNDHARRQWPAPGASRTHLSAPATPNVPIGEETSLFGCRPWTVGRPGSSRRGKRAALQAARGFVDNAGTMFAGRDGGNVQNSLRPFNPLGGEGEELARHLDARWSLANDLHEEFRQGVKELHAIDARASTPKNPDSYPPVISPRSRPQTSPANMPISPRAANIKEKLRAGAGRTGFLAPFVAVHQRQLAFSEYQARLSNSVSRASLHATS